METAPALDILIIEDDADTRANLQDILELDDHRIVTAASASEALAREDWERYAAVILDRRLPDSTAEALMPLLKTRTPKAAIIVVTGYADLDGAIAALRLGAADYLLKPINVEMLRASLGRITERNQLALDKQRSESMFRQLVEAAECLIVIVRLDRTIAYFSPFAERLSGYSAGEALRRDLAWLLRIGEQESSRLLARVAQAPVQGFQTSIACKDGGERSILWNARLLPDHGAAPAIMLVGHDVTVLKEAQERLVRSERLAAIGEVVAGLAHESRNALQRSQACLEMLALQVAGQPAALDLIDRLQNAQDHLHHLYEDVRLYAAPFKIDRTATDSRAIWREAWSHLESLRQKKQAELTEFVAADPHLLADPFRLRQVLHNLFDNALAASPIPARIEIATASATLDGLPALSIAVRDNGPGVPVEARTKIFEPFLTTKAKGTGLGLAIARRIIDAHGGRIEILDDGRPGACFLITLPKGLP